MENPPKKRGMKERNEREEGNEVENSKEKDKRDKIKMQFQRGS
jgi:hypothetical protein